MKKNVIRCFSLLLVLCVMLPLMAGMAMAAESVPLKISNESAMTISETEILLTFSIDGVKISAEEGAKYVQILNADGSPATHGRIAIFNGGSLIASLRVVDLQPGTGYRFKISGLPGGPSMLPGGPTYLPQQGEYITQVYTTTGSSLPPLPFETPPSVTIVAGYPTKDPNDPSKLILQYINWDDSLRPVNNPSKKDWSKAVVTINNGASISHPKSDNYANFTSTISNWKAKTIYTVGISGLVVDGVPIAPFSVMFHTMGYSDPSTLAPTAQLVSVNPAGKVIDPNTKALNLTFNMRMNFIISASGKLLYYPKYEGFCLVPIANYKYNPDMYRSLPSGTFKYYNKPNDQMIIGEIIRPENGVYPGSDAYVDYMSTWEIRLPKLEPNKDYTLVGIATCIDDPRLDLIVEYSFKTSGADPTASAPKIVSVSANTSNDGGPQLNFTFSEKMEKTSPTANILLNDVGCVWQWNSAKNVLTVPMTKLKPNTAYTIVLYDFISEAGIKMEPTGFAFATGSSATSKINPAPTTPPAVTPAPGGQKPPSSPTGGSVGAGKVTSKRVAVYPKASTKGKRVGYVANTNELTVLELTASYAKVQAGDIVGYVPLSKLSMTYTESVSGTISKKTVAYTQPKATKKNKAADLQKGAPITIIGRSGTWYIVDIDGKTAHVPVKNVII